jgi:hypothetical protein
MRMSSKRAFISRDKGTFRHSFVLGFIYFEVINYQQQPLRAKLIEVNDTHHR